MTDARNDEAADWIEEREGDSLRLGYRVTGRVFSGTSSYQRIEVVDTGAFGRMLFNDGVVMVSERDEFVYHEMIAHVPLFVHPRPRRVLVIGGGDGGSVREVLRHPEVEHCRLVEIDGMVLDACREHLPSMAGSLADPRVEVTVGDGVAFVERTGERYDLVLVDSTDPVGPAEPLFGPGFYSAVHRVLREDGVVVSQAESPFLHPDRQRALLRILGDRFERVGIYNYANITYPGGFWSFTFAARGDLCPLGDLDDARVERSGLAFRYYSPEVHRAAFVLPPFQAQALRGLRTPFK